LSKGRIILRVAKRLTSVALLYDALSLWGVGIHSTWLHPVLSTVVSALVGLVVLTGSPGVYALALSLITVISQSASNIPVASIIGLFTILILDNLSNIYRGGEVSWLEISRLSIARSASTLLLVLAVVMAPLFIAVIAASTLIASVQGLIVSASITKPLLSLVISSKIFTISLTVALLVYMYRFSRSAVEVVSVFIAPSRGSALGYLSDESDITVAFKTPFTWIIWLGASLLVYPVFYTMLHDIYLAGVLSYIRSNYAGYASYIAEALTGFAVFTMTATIVSSFAGVGGVDDTWLTSSANRAIIVPVSTLLLVYFSAVALSLSRGHALIDSILNPGFSELAGLIASRYTDYGGLLMSLINDVSRILGLAP